MNTDSVVRAVVAFPLLEADDRQWIESIRAKHDPEAKRIAAHFTLVFPAVLPLRAMEAHVSPRRFDRADPVCLASSGGGA